MSEPFDDLPDLGKPPAMYPCCARCYDGIEDGETILVTAPCAEEPERLSGYPVGMYHCPDCGAMVLAGCEHPPLCLLCATGAHPAFDRV